MHNYTPDSFEEMSAASPPRSSRRRRLSSGAAALSAAFLALISLAFVAGCRRDESSPIRATQETKSAISDTAAAGLSPDDEALVDQIAPPSGPSADKRAVQLSDRSRELVRQMVALSRRREEAVGKHAASDPATKALYDEMHQARAAYQKHVAELPEVAGLDSQIAIIRKQLQEMQTLSEKID